MSIIGYYQDHDYLQSKINFWSTVYGNATLKCSLCRAKRPPTRMMGAKEGKEEEEAKQQLLVNRVHNRRVSRPWHRTNSAGASGQRLLLLW